MSDKLFSDACHLPASVDNAYALLTDEAAIVKSYAGKSGVAVTVDETQAGHHVSVNREVHIGPEAPALLRPLMRNRLTLQLQQDWQKMPDSASANVSYKLVNTPVSITGEMQLTPAVHGSTLSTKLQAHVGIPVFGSLLAGYLAKVAAKKVEGDLFYQRDELLRRGAEA